jgi:hypothetical protein
MEYSFPRYLLAKQTVDDRALNKDVVNALRVHLPNEPVSVIEVGGGIGTMLKRLIRWDLFRSGEYTLVDSMPENIEYARAWIPQWAAETGLTVEGSGQEDRYLCDNTRKIRLRLVCADVFEFIEQNQKRADLLIAHAFLDLLPMPGSLEKLFSLTKGLAWLTINFDGVSCLLPEIDPSLDGQIERLYHATMDSRPTGGDSRMGRKLFEHLKTVQAEILSAGASDWVVYPQHGSYPADERYFLQFILHFFETSLKNCTDLSAGILEDWLLKRQEQVNCSELTYIAHQMDFLVKGRPAG